MNSKDVIVITGASAGVGRAAALAFARRGACIGLIARDPAALSATLAEVEELGGQGLTVSADVADPEQVEAAATGIERHFGRIDVWVNNAMTSVFGRVENAKPEEIRRVLDVNFMGAVHGTLSALRRMKPRRRGKIVQVGSALSYRGIPLQAAYCASKHALRGFTESLRVELLHDQIPIGLTMVQLPALNTPQFDWVKSRLERRAQPVPPIFQPEVAAEAIVWAAYHDRRELFVGGSTLKAIWGNKVVPWLGDWMLARSGFSSQQVDEPEDPKRPHNLWQPVTGVHSTHGRFDARARSRSWHLIMTTHRGALLGAASLVIVVLALWWLLHDGIV